MKYFVSRRSTEKFQAGGSFILRFIKKKMESLSQSVPKKISYNLRIYIIYIKLFSSLHILICTYFFFKLQKKLKKLMQKELDVTQASSGESSMWATDDAYSKVIGKDRHGRVRGVGFGPTPSMLSDISSKNSEQLKIISMEEILRDKDREICELKDRLASIEAKVESLFSRQPDAQSSKVFSIPKDLVINFEILTVYSFFYYFLSM